MTKVQQHKREKRLKPQSKQQWQTRGRCSISDSSSRGGAEGAIMALERAIETENSKTHSSWGGTKSAPLSLLPVKTIRGNYLAYRPNNISLIPLIHHQLLFFSYHLVPMKSCWIQINSPQCEEGSSTDLLMWLSVPVSLLSPRAVTKEMCALRQGDLMDQGKQDTLEISNFSDTALES